MPRALKSAGMVCTDSTKGSFSALAPQRRESPRGWSQAARSLASQLVALSKRLGSTGFLLACEPCKAVREGAHLEALAKFVRSGTTVIDVGANAGFYTRRFAQWVRPGGEVIAIEPEEVKFSTVRRVISRHGLVNVKAVHAMASEHAEAARSASADGGVEAVRLDDLVGAAEWPTVSLIRIAVRGAAERVLRGASETLRKSGPAVLVEMNDAALTSAGSSAQAVLNLLASFGYEAHHLVSRRLCRIGREASARYCKGGTYGVFFLRQSE
jgi:FkbM family methyltransferase